MTDRRRLSPRALAIAIAGGLLFVAGTTAQAGWLFVLAAGVIGLVVGSLVTRQNLSGARVERMVPTRVRVGDAVRVGLEVRNEGRRKLPMMRVTDSFAAFAPSIAASERLATGEKSHIEGVRVALTRGRYESGQCSLRSGAPFGFMSTTRVVEVESPLVVVPNWVEVSSFPILEPSSIPSDVLHERARTGAGEEYMGVREYRPGDPPRSVHWRSTARAGRLVVREFEEEIASKVSLVIAGADTGVPPDSAFELLVSAAASLAIYALQTGHPVELVRYGPDGAPLRLDGPDRFSVLDWLADARALDAPVTPLVSQALAGIGRRGTLVVLAPTTGVAGADVPSAVRMVQSAGSRAIVVAVRSTSWNGEPHADEPLMSALRGGRASLRFISKGDDLTRCLSSIGIA